MQGIGESGAESGRSGTGRRIRGRRFITRWKNGTYGIDPRWGGGSEMRARRREPERSAFENDSEGEAALAVLSSATSGYQRSGRRFYVG